MMFLDRKIDRDGGLRAFLLSLGIPMGDLVSPFGVMASVRDPRPRCKHLDTFSLNQELVGVAYKISVHGVQAGPSEIP